MWLLREIIDSQHAYLQLHVGFTFWQTDSTPSRKLHHAHLKKKKRSIKLVWQFHQSNNFSSKWVQIQYCRPKIRCKKGRKKEFLSIYMDLAISLRKTLKIAPMFNQIHVPYFVLRTGLELLKHVHKQTRNNFVCDKIKWFHWWVKVKNRDI